MARDSCTAGTRETARASGGCERKSVRVMAGGVLLIAVGLAGWASIAAAADAGGTDGGNTVTVGASNTSVSPGFSDNPRRGASDGGQGPSCTYTQLSGLEMVEFAAEPGGPTPGRWFLAPCEGASMSGNGHLEWLYTGPSAARAPTVVSQANPGAAAEEAEASIVLPMPSIDVNPVEFSVVNLRTWLAIAPALWHPYGATATVGGVTATALATPETVRWTMGDGGVVECAGPGTQYAPDLAASLQSTSCGYTYERSSDGEPSRDGEANDGAFPVMATVTWKVTWTAVGAPGGGPLPSLQTTSTTAIRVEQVESVGAGQ